MEGGESNTEHSTITNNLLLVASLFALPALASLAQYQPFNSCTPEVQNSFMSFMLQYLSRSPPETSSLALKACALAVGKVAREIEDEDGNYELPFVMSSYPNLFSTLSTTLCNTSSPEACRLAAVQTLGSGVIELIAENFCSNPQSQEYEDYQTKIQLSCLNVLSSALNDPYLPVRNEAVRAMSTLFQTLPTDEVGQRA